MVSWPKPSDDRPDAVDQPDRPLGAAWGGAVGARLPLDARIAGDRNLEIRLPVRAEAVTVTKRAVVTEEVRVRVRSVETMIHPSATVERERLRVETAGDVSVRSADPPRPL